ncbi:DUF6376 family protein [Oceanobacillus profundus]|uniref:DUF6376 family protein n=1 Tax=Oceanobacillus TaxID=182709 RepID=UPI00203AEE5A|nr:DUF6376 family protein [Oceanobacillus profundus]MCM3399272.1 DUF6376 family protein [Oceanobacillus profundus]
MKKLIMLLLISTVLSGCSFIEETNNTLDYATEATEYLNELSSFTEEVPGLVDQAVSDPAVQEDLKSHFIALEESIADFNAIDVPELAEGLHQNFTEKNQQLLDITSNVIQNGEVAVEKLEESELFQTIETITELQNQIEDLGF